MHAKETKQGEKVKDRACYYRHHGWPIERISMLVNYIGDLFFTPLKKPSFIFLYRKSQMLVLNMAPSTLEPSYKCSYWSRFSNFFYLTFFILCIFPCPWLLLCKFE
jgi:hypothetical protein